MDAELIIELIKIIQFEENNKTNATLRKKIEERDSDE